MHDRRGFLTGMVAAATGLFIDGPRLFSQQQEPPGVTLRRLSWAGLSVESSAVSIFIDPWITPGIWDGNWKEPIIPLNPRNPRRTVLITHLHNDHFDPAAVRELVGERGQVICPASMAVSVASRGFRVRPVELFAPETIDDFTVTALPASDGLGIEQVSWMISRNGRRIIHCGDTLWHGRFRTFGQSYGPFDFAFLPVNGARIGDADERGPGPPDVMPPDQAVYAAAVLGARVLVPIHYGMSTLDYVEHPTVRESVLAASHKTIPRITVRWLSPGESTAWMADGAHD